MKNISLKLLIICVYTFIYNSNTYADSSINVINFGAIGDYDFISKKGTDNTSAFQKALDTAAVKGARIFIPAGNYLTGTLRFYPNKTNKYPKGTFGRVSIIGEGPAIFLSKEPKTATGTILIHKDDEHYPLIDLVGLDSGKNGVVAVSIKDMSLLSGNKTTWLINMKMTTALNRLENLQLKIMPGNPLCSGISMVDSWDTVVSGVKIQGIANQRGTGTSGTGIYVNATTETSNLTSFNQVDIYGMGRGIQLGRTSMSSGGVIGPIIFQNSQVSHSDNIGIYIGNGTRNIKFDGFHTEFNYLEGLVVTQGAMNVSYSGSFSNNYLKSDLGFNVFIGGYDNNLPFAREIILNEATFFGCINGIKIQPNVDDGDCKNVFLNNLVFFPNPKKGNIGIEIDGQKRGLPAKTQITKMNVTLGKAVDFSRNNKKFKIDILDNYNILLKPKYEAFY